MQMEWLQSNIRVKLEVNQLQLSLAHTPMLDNGLYAHIRPVLGSTKIQRIREAVAAEKVTLTKEEWYKLYCAAGHTLA